MIFKGKNWNYNLSKIIEIHCKMVLTTLWADFVKRLWVRRIFRREKFRYLYIINCFLMSMQFNYLKFSFQNIKEFH